MANQWFRLYAEFATDPKVQMMNESMQRRYIMLLCMRCSNSLVTLHDEEVAFQLRITAEDLAETKALFVKKGFISSTWDLLNWEKRQFASDASASRVAKHRALQKAKQETLSNGDVTLHKQKCNALEQNRTEQIQNNTTAEKSADSSFVKQKTEPEGFTEFWETWPTNDRKQAKGKCLDAWKKASAERDAAVVLAHVSFLKNTAWLRDGGQFVPAPLVYLNQRRWEGAESQSDQSSGGMLAGAI